MLNFVSKRAAALACLFLCAASAAQAADLSPTHTVIVVLENQSAFEVYDGHEMPFFNWLAAHGAMMTNATFAQTPYGRVPRGFDGPLPARPSQPNYLYLLAGNNQGVLPDYFRADPAAPDYSFRGTAANDANGDLLPQPVSGVATGIGNRLIPASVRPFTTPNLAAAVIEHGGSFASYSESLPYPAFDGESAAGPDGTYKRKHNPAINWINLGGRQIAPERRRFVLPPATNLGFAATSDPFSGRRYRGFAVDESGAPLGFDLLPTVALVVPSLIHDAHDGSRRQADDWLRRNIKPYADWAMTHQALLIVTFDEDGSTKAAAHGAKRAGIDTIGTVFFGPMIKPGRYAEPVDHLNVLSTVLQLHADIDGFRRDFAAAYRGPEAERELANLRPIRDIFGAGPALTPLDPAAAAR